MTTRHDETRLDPDCYLSPGVDLPIFFGDLDMYGHVNNVTLGRYFEQCRYIAHSSDGGLHTVLDESGAKSLVAKVVYNYLAETLPSSPLHVRLRVDGIGRTSATEQLAAWQGQKCVALAEVTIVHLREGRPEPWSARALDALKAWRTDR